MPFSFQTAFWILTGILLLFTLIPLIRRDHWSFRIFEFPRFQKWVINVAILVAYLTVSGLAATIDWWMVGLLVLNLGYLSFQIYPYLPFAPKQIQSALANQEPDIKILISNVFQDNKEFEKLNSLVHEMDADIVLLVETNQWWKGKCIEGFGDKYEFRILEDKENTYRMLLFSKFPLSNQNVRYLIKEKIPSIVTK